MPLCHFTTSFSIGDIVVSIIHHCITSSRNACGKAFYLFDCCFPIQKTFFSVSSWRHLSMAFLILCLLIPNALATPWILQAPNWLWSEHVNNIFNNHNLKGLLTIKWSVMIVFKLEITFWCCVIIDKLLR